VPLVDADKDGMVFEKEVVAFFDRWGDLPDLMRAACVTMSVSEDGRGLFDLLDSDRDGRLSVRELRQLPKLLEKFDFNGDGYLQPDEFPPTTTLHRGGVPAAPSGVFTIVYPAGEAPPPPAPSAGPLWFRKMDRNRDGDVSRAEFLGSDEEFRRIDTDGDGLISREEAER